MRLVTLKTISCLDLWKDVPHGKKSEKNMNALAAWTKNLQDEKVPFTHVTRWSTVEQQALKWV